MSGRPDWHRVAVALAIAAGAVGVDAWSKNWALVHAQGWPPRSPLPGVELTVTLNTGSAFGLAHGTPGAAPVLVGLAIALCIGLGWLAIRWLPRSTPASVAVGLVAGGTLGNLADRVLRTIEVWGELPQPAVIDFIVVRLSQHTRWPAFNLADVALVVGLPWVALLSFGAATVRRAQATGAG